MTRRTGKENLHQRIVEMDVKKRREDLIDKEVLFEADYESCFDDLPANVRKAYLNGTWDL
jgi:hypothetical protein